MQLFSNFGEKQQLSEANAMTSLKEEDSLIKTSLKQEEPLSAALNGQKLTKDVKDIDSSNQLQTESTKEMEAQVSCSKNSSLLQLEEEEDQDIET